MAIDLQWPPPARAWATTVILTLTAILSYTDRLVISLLVDPLRAQLHITDTQVGLLQGMAFALVYSVAGLPLGRLSDRYSRCRVITAGVLIWSLSTLLCAMAQSFEALIAARVGVGVGEAALTPAAVSLIADSFPSRRRGAATAVYIMGMVVGSGAAIAIGASALEAAQAGTFSHWPVVGQWAPWRQVLALLSILGLPVLGLIATLREPSRQQLVGQARMPLALAIRGLGARGGAVWPLCLALSLSSVGDYTILSWVPTLLARRFAWSAGEIATDLGAVVMLGAACGALGAGLSTDRFAVAGAARVRLTLATMIMSIGVVGTGIGWCASGFQVVMLVGLWMLSSVAAVTAGTTALQEIVPGQLRSASIAVVGFGSVGLGLGLGVMLAGTLTDHVFKSADSVGHSISAIAAPAAFAAAFLYWRARSVARSLRL